MTGRFLPARAQPDTRTPSLSTHAQHHAAGPLVPNPTPQCPQELCCQHAPSEPTIPLSSQPLCLPQPHPSTETPRTPSSHPHAKEGMAHATPQGVPEPRAAVTARPTPHSITSHPKITCCQRSRLPPAHPAWPSTAGPSCLNSPPAQTPAAQDVELGEHKPPPSCRSLRSRFHGADKGSERGILPRRKVLT